jgi:RIO-like serine/threonine protein kinase
MNLAKTSIHRKDILPEFKKIIGIAIFLSAHLPHGDVLPHNIVYRTDGNGNVQLTLIDVDEGVSVENP